MKIIRRPMRKDGDRLQGLPKGIMAASGSSVVEVGSGMRAHSEAHVTRKSLILILSSRRQCSSLIKTQVALKPSSRLYLQQNTPRFQNIVTFTK